MGKIVCETHTTISRILMSDKVVTSGTSVRNVRRCMEREQEGKVDEGDERYVYGRKGGGKGRRGLESHLRITAVL